MEPGLALVRDNQNQKHDVERSYHDPAIRGGPMRHHRQREQQEANVLRDPRAAPHHPTLSLRPGLAHRRRYFPTRQRAGEPHRAGEEPCLAADVVAVDPGHDAATDGWIVVRRLAGDVPPNAVAPPRTRAPTPVLPDPTARE